jgi:F0F1-type ATP synthase assembly protein I
MFLIKLAVSNLIIVACVLIGRRFPSLGGLIATMPLTSLIVLIWLAADNPGNTRLLGDYTRGVLWGILPTIGFFIAAFICLRKGAGLPIVLVVAGSVWLCGALLHQYLLR